MPAITSKLLNLGRAGLDLLVPPSCASCGEDLVETVDVLLCSKCREQIPPLSEPLCSRCGARHSGREEQSRCPRCAGRRLAFDAAVPFGVYHGPLREIVLKMKRPAGHALSTAVARLMSRSRSELLREHNCQLVVPVPMHWTRRLTRGTNSPDTVAEELSRQTGLPFGRGLLTRRRNTVPQTELSPAKRFENVRGAFRMSASYDLSGLRVVLVDDILTTGATCSEAAKVLRKAGASYVVVVVVARADFPN